MTGDKNNKVPATVDKKITIPLKLLVKDRQED